MRKSDDDLNAVTHAGFYAAATHKVGNDDDDDIAGGITKMSQSQKKRFRSNSAWRNFRKQMLSDSDGRDCITLTKIRKGADLHHKDMRSENYENISDPARFSFLNTATHKTVHFLYRYYVKDKKVLTRLQMMLDDMIKYSNDRI